MTKRAGLLFCAALLLVGFSAGLSGAASGQTAGQANPQKDVPVMDGGAGPCSVEFTVNDAEGKPVYAAEVKVHIVYGFRGLRKLDLSSYTNAQGRLNFTGLPARVYRGPMEFRATKEQLTGRANWDPVDGCRAKQTIVLGLASR